MLIDLSDVEKLAINLAWEKSKPLETQARHILSNAVTTVLKSRGIDASGARILPGPDGLASKIEVEAPEKPDGNG